jgi:hypothetical protein
VLRNRERAHALEREKVEVQEMIERYRQKDEEERLAHREKVRHYGDDLTQQMQYNTKQRNIVSTQEEKLQRN